MEVIVGVLGTVIAAILLWVGSEVMQTRDAVKGIAKDIENLAENSTDHEERIRSLERGDHHCARN